MAVLQATNVQGTLCVNGVAVGGGKDFKYCCFTGSTTFTPTQDLVDGNGFLDANLVAGGGGGGAAAIKLCTIDCNNQTCVRAFPGTGFVGEIFSGIRNITATTGCTVTIGAGGTGGTINMPTTFEGPAIETVCHTASLAGGNTAFGSLIVSGGRNGTDCYAGKQHNNSEFVLCSCSFPGTTGVCSNGSSCLDYRAQFGQGSGRTNTGTCCVASCDAPVKYCSYDTPNDKPKAGACYGLTGEANGGIMCGVSATSPFVGGGTNRPIINFIFSNPGTFYCNVDATSPAGKKCQISACTFGSSGGCAGVLCSCNFEAGGSNFQYYASGSGGDGFQGIVVLKWQE
tara:strand:+ start:22 stop:1044 length:1023 start_codon:yes stop_codon:yes gene_type:complete